MNLLPVSNGTGNWRISPICRRAAGDASTVVSSAHSSYYYASVNASPTASGQAPITTGEHKMPTVQHMVVVRFKGNVGATQIEEMMDELRQFWNSTPGITYHAAGEYASPEGLNQGYTHGFLVTFASPADRDAYLRNPEHDRLVARILPTLDG